MIRSIFWNTIFSLGVFLTACGLTLGAGEERPVKLARSGDQFASPSTQQADSLSLSTGLTLPMLNPNPSVPQVVLSEKHKDLCRKRVGDQIDQVAVKDVSGREVKIKEELSDRFTVLIFWSEKSVSGYEQFRRIPVDVLAKYAPHRVKVVTVNVGGSVEETHRLTGRAAKKILSLADTDSALFHQFASTHVPRTYVLDKDGRILWFDMEYSESTRRSLDNALTYFIRQSDPKVVTVVTP